MHDVVSWPCADAAARNGGVRGARRGGIGPASPGWCSPSCSVCWPNWRCVFLTAARRAARRKDSPWGKRRRQWHRGRSWRARGLAQILDSTRAHPYSRMMGAALAAGLLPLAPCPSCARHCWGFSRSSSDLTGIGSAAAAAVGRPPSAMTIATKIPVRPRRNRRSTPSPCRNRANDQGSSLWPSGDVEDQRRAAPP